MAAILTLEKHVGQDGRQTIGQRPHVLLVAYFNIFVYVRITKDFDRQLHKRRFSI